MLIFSLQGHAKQITEGRPRLKNLIINNKFGLLQEGHVNIE